jgi:hypothetical protein
MSKYPKTSVIDLAMGILENMDAGKDVLPDSPAPRKRIKDPNISDFVPDVTDTNVSEDYIANILEGSMGVTVERKKKVVIKEQKKLEPKPTKINEEKITDLISRLSSLLAEAKQMLNEMTTVGMIGTNLSGKSSKKK